MTPPDSRVPDATTTCELVSRARDGDEQAFARLVSTFAPLLEQWAHGRLARATRGPVETVDLVQETLVAVYQRLGSVRADRPGAFWVYLRRSLEHRLSNAHRNAARRPSADVAIENAQLPAEAWDTDLLDYERALESLDEDQRAVVILRLEFGFSHDEVARALDLASADAARMRATRAVTELAAAMTRS